MGGINSFRSQNTSPFAASGPFNSDTSGMTFFNGAIFNLTGGQNSIHLLTKSLQTLDYEYGIYASATSLLQLNGTNVSNLNDLNNQIPSTRTVSGPLPNGEKIRWSYPPAMTLAW